MRFFAPSGFATQQWTYDSLLRLTGIPTMGITYQYSANNDDGKITSMTYTAAGYAVNYTYDALGRLATANTSGNQWGLSYLYDGFGNRLQQNVTKAGPGFTPPSSNLFVDPNTNRVNSWTYDANGNATNIPGVGNIAFDWNNRVSTVGSESYGYDPGNKRLWKNNQLTLWGGRSEEIGRFELQWLQDGQWALKFKQISTLRYFAGRKLQQEDRLGSANATFYPYGEEISSWAPNPADKFATYHRDGTGLDYADQRWHAPGAGRFLTADPYQASGGAADPGSWNRYGYVEGDPVNYNDPAGLAKCDVISVHNNGYGQFARIQCSTALGRRVYENDIDPQPYYGNPLNQADTRRNEENYNNGVGAQLDRAEVAQELYFPFWSIIERAFQLEDCAAFFAGNDVVSWQQAWANWSVSFRTPSPSLLGGLPRAAETEGGERGIIDAILGRPYKSANTRIDPNVWLTGSVFDRALIVLHELGHAIAFMSRGSFNAGGFIHQDNSFSANNHNDIGITERCLNPLGLR